MGRFVRTLTLLHTSPDNSATKKKASSMDSACLLRGAAWNESEFYMSGIRLKIEAHNTKKKRIPSHVHIFRWVRTTASPE
jgi:hypothetical protein